MKVSANVSDVNEFVKERILVYLKKNKDYGDSFLASILHFGEVSALVRLNDKVNRYIQLSHNKTDTEVEDESLNDTILDLFNYAMMYTAFLNDGARILLVDLVVCMNDEALEICYGDYTNSTLFKILTNKLEVADECATSILRTIKAQIKG